MVESRHARISSTQDVQEYIGLIMFGHDVCVCPQELLVFCFPLKMLRNGLPWVNVRVHM